MLIILLRTDQYSGNTVAFVIEVIYVMNARRRVVAGLGLFALTILGGGVWAAHLTTQRLVPRVYFSPGGGSEDAIVKLLDQATRRIYVAMFYMSNPGIVDALVRAKERGVEIFAVFDDSQRKSFRFLDHGVRLRMNGIPVRYGHPDQKMHSKFAVMDGRRVVTGSYNWTESAESKNVEDFVVLEDCSLARAYETQFVRIWDDSENP